MFNPKGFVGRMLGMGDLEALLEKAQEVMDADMAEDLGRKLLKGDFNFLDLYEQMAAMRKMGPLSKVVEMIPGMGGQIPKEMLEGQEGKRQLLKQYKQSKKMMKMMKGMDDPSKLMKKFKGKMPKGFGM